jgi:hypothetical protein
MLVSRYANDNIGWDEITRVGREELNLGEVWRRKIKLTGNSSIILYV